MRLPFLGELRWSKFNGFIRVSPLGEVWVGGVRQTSTRYAQIWANAFMRAALHLTRPVTDVLLLGLAGGGALLAIYGTYQGARVTAVEIDPVMTDIASRLHDGTGQYPAVVIDDVHVALKTLGDFDVILVDIFTGPVASPHLDDDAFWQRMSAHLRPGGAVILNVAGLHEKTLAAKRNFARFSTWLYGTNTFCALSN